MQLFPSLAKLHAKPQMTRDKTQCLSGVDQRERKAAWCIPQSKGCALNRYQIRKNPLQGEKKQLLFS